MSSRRIVLFGAGAHAAELRALFSTSYAAIGHSFAACWVDLGFEQFSRFEDLPLYTSIPSEWDAGWCLVPAVKNGFVRERVASEAAAHGICLAPAALHPRSFVDPTATVASGTVVFPGAVVSAYVTIGDAAIVHANATIAHDTTIGAFAFVGPGATICGNVAVGDAAFIGAGAVLLPGVSIGAGSLVGAGAVVNADVASKAVIRRRSELDGSR